MAQLGQRLEKYGEFVMDTYLLFSSVYNAPSSFSKSKRSLRCKERGTLQARRPLLSNVMLSVL
jgi:hypothetical protein